MTLGPASVTVVGVVLKPHVQEVGIVCSVVEKVLVFEINDCYVTFKYFIHYNGHYGSIAAVSLFFANQKMI